MYLRAVLESHRKPITMFTSSFSSVKPFLFLTATNDNKETLLHHKMNVDQIMMSP